MLSDFLIFGGIWFWLAVLFLTICIFWRLEDALNESRDNGGGFGVTLIFLSFLAAYFFFGSSDHLLNILSFIKQNVLIVVGLTVLYFIIGLGWSFGKWYFFLLKEKDQYKYRVSGTKIPNASDNKNRIMTWMCYWPFSGLWTLIDEPIKKGFNHIFNKFKSRYDKMAESMFSDVTNIKGK
jgi:hypothetical protein